MKIYKVGDVEKALCETCKAVVSAKFMLKDVPFSDASGIVKNVLVGCCNKCLKVIVTPHQSTPLIHKKIMSQKQSLETRVPAHMLDILNLASEELGGGTDFSTPLVKYYLNLLSQQEENVTDLAKYLDSDLAKGKSQKRISLKGRFVADRVNQIRIKANIESTSDIVKAVVLRIHNDVLVAPQPELLGKLRTVAATFL